MKYDLSSTEWAEMETPNGTVEWLFEWNDLVDHLHVRKGDRTITLPAARLIAQYASLEGAVKAMAKELDNLVC